MEEQVNTEEGLEKGKQFKEKIVIEVERRGGEE